MAVGLLVEAAGAARRAFLLVGAAAGLARCRVERGVSSPGPGALRRAPGLLAGALDAAACDVAALDAAVLEAAVLALLEGTVECFRADADFGAGGAASSAAS